MKSYTKHYWSAAKKILTTPEFVIFIVTFFLHAVVAVFLNMSSLSVAYGADSLSYHDWGTQIAGLLRSGQYHFDDVYPYHWYPLFVGVVYAIFGASALIGSFINGFLAAIAALFFFKILRGRGVSVRIAAWTSVIALNLYASFMFHSSLLLKESWVVVLMLVIFYLSQRMAQGKGNRGILFVGILALFIALYDLRFFIGGAVIVGVLVEWFLGASLSVRRRLIYGIPMVIVVVIAGCLLFKSELGKTMDATTFVSPETVYETRTAYARDGGSNTNIAIFKKVEDTTSSKYVLYIPGLILSSANTLLGPFPWQLPLQKYVLQIPDLVFIYAVVTIVILGLFIYRRPLRGVVPYIVTSGLVLGVIIIANDNLGAIVRQRIPAFIVLGLSAIIWAAPWLETKFFKLQSRS